MDLQERAHLQAVIDNKQRRLHVLEERAAKQGYNTPPEVTLEIRDLRTEIQQHKQERDGSATPPSPQPNVFPPPSVVRPAPTSRSIDRLFWLVGGVASIIGIIVFFTGRPYFSSFVSAEIATIVPAATATGTVGPSATIPDAAVATGISNDISVPTASAVEPAAVEVAPAAAPSYPCEATITNKRGDVVDMIRQFPNEGSSKQASLNAGTPIIVKRTSASSNDWLEIANRDGLELGWILREYLVVSPSCPL